MDAAVNCAVGVGMGAEMERPVCRVRRSRWPPAISHDSRYPLC